MRMLWLGGMVLVTACTVHDKFLGGDDGGDASLVDAGPGQFTVDVTTSGSGGGTITSSPAGIDCGTDCSAPFDEGTSVTLTATADNGSTFLGWTGGRCTGTGTCALDDLADDASVEASFGLDNSVVVTKAGTGTGTVTSSPSGINCGSDCDEAYSPDTMVTLTATPTGDSFFAGWSGGSCSGMGTCQITVDDAVLVTATFTLDTHTLDVTIGGSGDGTVASSPAGVTCPTDCMQDYDSGTLVMLTPTATVGQFTGWSGDCSGPTCMVTMTADRSVTANFVSITVTNVTSPTVDGIYKAPMVIPIQVSFSQPVAVTGSPTLSLATSPGATATYSGGSGSATLTFDYTVATGQAASDLDYTGTAALTGGTITDDAGHNATLTLPAPGAAGSLGANKALVIDAIAPVISAIGAVAAYNSAAATATWTVTEVHPGSTNCAFTVGAGTLTSCSATGVSISGMNEGAHTLSVTHTDTAGNATIQTLSFAVDTVAPSLTAIAGVGTYASTSSVSLTYTLTELNSGSTSCNMTAGTGTLGTCTNDGVGYTALSEGAHTVTAQHTDLAGLTSQLRTISWTVDTIDPVVSAISGPAAYVSSTSASLSYTVTDTNLGDTTCVQTVGTGTVVACTNTGVSYAALSQGAHTVTITHTDLAGRMDSQQYSWVVDTIAPVIGTVSGPSTPTPATTADLSWALTEANPSSSGCSITHGGTQTACTHTAASYTGVPGGQHIFTVTHTDLAGNPSTPKTYSWTVLNNVAFVTSVSGNANLASWADSGGSAGLTGADAVCRVRAIQAGLSDPDSYVAWLSSTTTDAYCRVHGFTGTYATNCGQAVRPTGAGPWVRPDGQPFAAAMNGTSVKYYMPPIITELNTVLVGSTNGFGIKLLTNTFPDGRAVTTTATCGDWSLPSGADIVRAGATGYVTYWSEGPTGYCDENMNIVCMQKGAGAALGSFVQPGRRVFVSSVTGNGNLGTWDDAGGNVGVDAGDAICRARASAGDLANPAKYKAWLSTSTQSASAHLTSTGPWINSDGIVIAATKADLTDGALSSSVVTDEFGVFSGNAAWTGTLSSGASSGDTCGSWNSTGGQGTMSQGDAITDRWTNHSTNSCGSTGISLYCFED